MSSSHEGVDLAWDPWKLGGGVTPRVQVDFGPPGMPVGCGCHNNFCRRSRNSQLGSGMLASAVVVRHITETLFRYLQGCIEGTMQWCVWQNEKRETD